MKALEHNNQPIPDLRVESDILGHLPKIELIKRFLEGNVEWLKENKMLGIYGDWGSGKTTVLLKLQNLLQEEGNYACLFFEAWKFEKTQNLAFSLASFMYDQVENKSSEIDGFREKAMKVLSYIPNLAKATLPMMEQLVPGIDRAVENVARIINPGDERWILESPYRQIEELGLDFVKIEELILQETKAKRIIVFIDDLDRCEPALILDLLSSIKLFFTMGHNTIFLCAMDIMAVKAAVSHRYKEVIKAEEYLEKIFDHTFSVPRFSTISTFFDHAFPKLQASEKSILVEMFVAMECTNPRRLKKALNKYQFFQELIEADYDGSILGFRAPNLVNKEGAGDLLATAICLYAIVLSLYLPDKYEEMRKLKTKFQHYSQMVFESSSRGKNVTTNNSSAYESSFSSLRFFDLSCNDWVVHINRHHPNEANRKSAIEDFEKQVVAIFLPREGVKGNIFPNATGADLVGHFDTPGNEVLVGFCRFFLKNYRSLLEGPKDKICPMNLIIDLPLILL